MMFFKQQSPAMRNLYLYHLFISLALTIAANFTFIDRLLLRLQIDLSSFGVIKSFMYLAPAVIYQLCLPLLQRIGRDLQVCAVCYAVRVILPLFLPFLAIYCHDRNVLTVACAILLSGGMLFAVFANNALMKIYRQVIPVKQYNYASGVMTTLMSFPSFILALPFAWLLDRFNGLADREFFLLFGTLHFFTLLFEIPAIILLLKIKLPAAVKEISVKSSFTEMLRPYRSPELRILLLQIFVHRIVCGIGMAYITVFFLQVVKVSMTALVVISMLMVVAADIMRPFNGKLLDRWGYARTFPVLSAAILLGWIGICCFWEALWFLPFFAILAWDGLGSLCGSALSLGGYAAIGKLADRSWIGSAVAAYSLSSNSGFFTGFLSSSGLYAAAEILCGKEVGSALRCYYVMAIPLVVLLFAITLKVRQKKIM